MKFADVLAHWKAAEEDRWRPFFEERGFSSWEEWRESYWLDLHLEDRVWLEERIEDPHAVIPTYAIGGYRGWMPYRPQGKTVATYADVAKPALVGEMNYLDEPRVDVRTNQTVMGLLGKLHDTTILVMRSPNMTVVLDGAHRCAATAVEAIDGPRSSFRMTQYVASFFADEDEILKNFCKDRAIVVKKNQEK